MPDHVRPPLDRIESRNGRLDSWKEVARYLDRHVTTVRRWEKQEGLPVHRHRHDKLGSVYAYPAELDEWWQSRVATARKELPPSAIAPSGSRRALLLTATVLWSLVTLPSTHVLELAGTDNAGSSSPSSSRAAFIVRDVNPAARQEYLVGRYYLWRDNEPQLRRAIVHFQRATDLAPDYAAAYAGLAHAWWKLGLWTKRLSEVESPARAAAAKARQLDELLPAAYAVQADLERLYGGSLPKAEESLLHALTIDPKDVDANYSYGLLLMTLGRFDEAIAHMETAEQVDPLAPAIQSDFGRVLYRAGRGDEAIQRLNRALELEPAMGWLVYSRLAQVYEQKGEYEPAFAALHRTGRRGFEYQARMATILARMGRRDDARRLLRQAETVARRAPGSEVAAAYAALGDRDKAFALLFDRVRRDDPGPNFLAVDPPLASLRSDPRWKRLVQQVHQQEQLR